MSDDRLLELLSDAVPQYAGDWNSPGAPLTRQTILDAIEKVNDAVPHLCVGSDQHVVHPEEWKRGGLAICAACFNLIDLGPR